MTKIAWVKNSDGSAGRSWNPIAGCSILSAGCKNCFAMKMAARLEAMGVEHYRGLTKPSKCGAVWTGKIAIAPENIIEEPLHRNKPTTYFINSMSDLFHPDVPDEVILRVLDIVRLTSYDGGSNCGKIARGHGEHTYQLLTKRSARMRAFMAKLRFNNQAEGIALFLSDDSRRPVVLRNLWLGVSAEDQAHAGERIPDLLVTPAAIRFVSCEPLLSAIDFDKAAGSSQWFNTIWWDTHPGTCGKEPQANGIKWVICGGESGPGARPMDEQWVRDIRDQCVSAKVPFFYKQRLESGRKITMPELDGKVWDQMPGGKR